MSDKWDPKVTAIQEAKDLNTLPLDELMGFLIIHELTMQHRTEDEQKKRKSIALKAVMEKVEELEDGNGRGEGKEDEMLKYRRKARIALVVKLLGFSSGCWWCAGHQNDGEFVKAVEVKDDSNKIKYLS